MAFPKRPSASCVLCVALLATTAVAKQRPMFAELWHDAKVGIAADNPYPDYDYGTTQQVNLQEGKIQNCRTVGCKGLDNKCSEQTGGGCIDCWTHFVYQSDFTCEDKGSGDTLSDFQAPFLQFGVCDWDVSVDTSREVVCLLDPSNYQCTTARNGAQRAVPQFSQAPYAWKIGTAWATCYIPATSACEEYCGEHICGKTLSFQGGFFLSAVRSTTELSAFDTSESRCGPLLNTVTPGSRLGRGARKTAQGIQPGAAAKVMDAADGDQETFVGIALVASGTFTLTPLHIGRQPEYQNEHQQGSTRQLQGHMDYVYDFVSLGESLGTAYPELAGVDAYSFPVVRPQDYRLKIVGVKTATY